MGYNCVTSLGGANSANHADWNSLNEFDFKDVIFLPDNDDPGINYMMNIYHILKKSFKDANFKIVNLTNLPEKGDICDWIQSKISIEWDELSPLEDMTPEDEFEMLKLDFKEELKLAVGIPSEWNITIGSKGLSCISFYDFVNLNLPHPKVYLSPWLTEQSLTMVFAPRGVGKTFFSLNCAYALSSGKSFLKYNVEQPISVLYIDGEMQAPLMIERLKGISGGEICDLPIHIITPNLQKNRGMPDISTVEGQLEVDEIIDKFSPKVIFVDNLSTLCRTGKENDSESWNIVQVWAIKHRSQGRSIVFVHHANKDGGQRGSSKKEDILDNVILLQRPEDYDESKDGAKFEVIFKKNRSLFGQDTRTTIASLCEDGKWSWDYVQTKDEKALEMLNSVMKQKEIAHELGVTASAVSKMINRAKQSENII